MATIDSLDIKISAEASAANKAIGTLSQNLSTLSRNLGRLNGSSLTNFSNAMKNLSDGMKNLQGIKAVDFSPIVDGFKKLESIDSSKINSLSTAISGISASMSGISSVSFNPEGINKFATAMSAFGQQTFTQATANFNQIQQNLSSFVQGMNRIGSLTFDVNSLSNLINSISRLGGNTASAATQNLPKISQDLQAFINGLNGITAITFDINGLASLVNSITRLGGKTATAATANLPNISRDLQAFINGMNSIGSLTFDANSLATLINSISRLGGSAATAAIPNISSLATELRNMMAILSTAPRVSQNVIDMTNALARLARTGSSAGRASNALTSSVNTLSGSLGGLRGSAGNAARSMKSFANQILAGFGIYLGVIGAIRGIRKAIDISSDLTEVQNVVDVTFGDMSNKVEEFSQTSIEQFGMSELSLKQYASRFQAMGTAMGIDKGLIGNANLFLNKQTNGYVGLSDSMAGVSLNLTKLAADMASFYNVEQKVVAEDLEAIFTGQTRPLRQYGLDLTQATLQEWAMKQGLDANIQSMSQAEKTILRYQYVLAHTGAAQGDFARTSGTWANQTRILVQNFQQLGAVIGGTLINAFKPFVSTMNSVMQNVISFATTVANALGKIFGWTIQISSGGLASDFEAAGAGAEEMEKGTGGAAKNMKDMNKYIAAWHEVNNMTSDDSAGGGGGGGGGGAGGGGAADAAVANLVRTDTIFDKYKSDIDTLYELGKYIGDTLTKAMNDIDWDSIYEKARNFGTGLASFLNGLISPGLFGALGKTIAGSLNTALHFLDSFGTEFDWKNFGNSIAAGVNEFFDTFDFGLLSHTLNTWANGLLDALIEFIGQTDWGKIGTEIGTFLSGLDFTGVAGKVGKALWEAINAGIVLYKRMLTSAPIETAFITLLTSTKLLSKIKIYSGQLSRQFVLILGGALKNSLQYIRIGLSIGQPFSGLIDAARSASKEIQKELSKLSFGQKGVIGAATMLGEFALIKNGISDLISGPSSFGNLSISIGQIGIAAVAAKTILAGVFGAAGPVVAAIVGVAGAFKGIDDAMENMAENSSIGQFSQAISDLSKEVGEKTESIKANLENIKSDVEGAGVAEAQVARDLAKEYEDLSGKTALSSSEKERLKQISQELIGVIPELGGYIDEETGILDIQKESLDAVIQGYESLAQKKAAQESLVDAYKAQYEAQMNVKNAQDGYNEAFEKYLSNAGLAPNVIEQIRDNQFDLNQAELEWEKSPLDFEKHYGVKNFGTLQKAIYGLNEEMGTYTSTLNEVVEAEEKSAEAIDYLNWKISESEAKIEKSTEAKIKDKMTTVEYRQALSNLSTDFDNLGITISDTLKQELVLNEFDSSSLERFFNSMESGVQASSKEIKDAFTSLGLSLPDEIAKALEQKEPQVQAETVKILMQIKSGADVTKEQLKTALTNIGAELPDGIIVGLQAKNSEVQMAALDSLAMLENGYKLERGKIIELLNGLGVSFSDSLISSIASKDEEIQAQAIELLSQIQIASDSERPKLIEALKVLGLDVDQSFIDGLSDSGKMNEIKRVSQGIPNTAKSAIQGAMMSGGVNIFKPIGENAIKGFLEGLSSSALLGSVKAAAANMAKAAKDSAERELDEHSPSKAFRKIGSFTVEGFNYGILDRVNDTYSTVKEWTKGIASSFNTNLVPADLIPPSMPATYNVSPSSPPDIAADVQEQIDVQMATYMYEVRRQNELLEEQNALLERIYDKTGITEGEIFNATRKGVKSFQNRTKKNPWPVLA